MKTMKVTTYLNADEAEIIITFLSEIQDALWQQYHEEIFAAHQTELTADCQLDLDFDDPIPF
jgi:hypothetical protein